MNRLIDAQMEVYHIFPLYFQKCNFLDHLHCANVSFKCKIDWFPDLEAVAVQVLKVATATIKSQGDGADILPAGLSAIPAALHQAGG